MNFTRCVLNSILRVRSSLLALGLASIQAVWISPALSQSPPLREETAASSPAPSSASLPLTETSIRAVRELLPETPGIAPLEIQRGNAPQFKALIPPELYSLVREGSMRMFATRALPFPSRDRTPREETTEDSDDSQSCDLQLLQGQRAFPCGFEHAPGAIDPSRAYRMLRVNYEASLMPKVFSRSIERLDLYSGTRLLRVSRVERMRLVPDGQAEAPSAQLYRELVTLLNPASIKGYKFLTFRFVSGEEDLVWMYSPLLMKSRQLTATNRGEAVLGLGVALNDFDILSEHPDYLYPRTLERVEALMPIGTASGSMQAAEPRDLNNAANKGNTGAGCQLARFTASQEEEVDRAGVTPALISAAERFVRSTHFVPRPLYRVHLNSRDPFLPVGRVIVYFDEEYHVPLMKVTYGRTGKLRTLMVGALSVTTSSEGGITIPRIGQLLIFDEAQGIQVLVSTESTEQCDKLPAEYQTRMFDPSGLGETESAAS